MTVLPVIAREMRAQARQRLTYWLRIIGGVSLAAAFLVAWWKMEKEQAFWERAASWPRAWGRMARAPSAFESFGAALFGNLNLLIFCAIWVFVPLAVADAISRERREGTLPLLFLTQLNSWGIVVGKACAHIFRSLSLFLTMGPWLMLPVLFGGVEIRDFQLALTLDGASILLGMAAGLVATTWPRDWLKSVIVAEILATLLLLAFLEVNTAVVQHAANVGQPGPPPGSWQARLRYSRWDIVAPASQTGWLERFNSLLALATDWSKPEEWPTGFGGRTDWAAIRTRLTPAGQLAWINGSVALMTGSGFLFIASIGIGAWRIRTSWRDAQDTARESELKRRFFSPRFAAPFLYKRLSRALTANPIGWLEVRSPSARLIKWGWCLFIIGIEILFSRNSDDLYGVQRAFGLLLLLGMTFSATASFRKELATGAFELWLVTPLRERQIIAGRARGIWKQFLPALLVYAAGGIYLASGWNDTEHASDARTILVRMLCGFCAMPLVGLYFSIRRWNFFTAWLVASVVGLGLPMMARGLGGTETFRNIFQLSLGVVAAVLLEARLRRRELIVGIAEGRG